MLNISNKKTTILYTGSFRFPDKDAASQRVLGIAKALKINKIDAIFGGWEQSPRIEDLQEDGIYRFNGFEYYSQAELDHKSHNLFQKLYRFLFLGSKTILWIKNYLQNEKVSTIIVYNANSYFIYRLFRLSKKYSFKLVCDCTEWNEGGHLPGGKYGIVNLDNNIRIRIIYPLIKNVIVISSFLQRYLNKKGCNTLLVPPLIELKDCKWNNPSENTQTNSSDIIKLIYAGNPGKKDQLKSVFHALEIINKDTIRFEFNILGINQVSFKNAFFPDSDEPPSYIHCLGIVLQEEVPKYYQKNHFSILLREDKRYAHAGFPTKLVESMAAGVPLITNCTSDIPKYINDGENGFLLKDTSVNSILNCFHQILSLTENELYAMNRKAIKSSRENFDVQLFSNSLEDYILNLK